MASQEALSNFAYHVLLSLQRRPNKTLLVVNGESVSGCMFHEKVTSVVRLLQWHLVAAGSRILITMKPSVDFYATAVGALAVGCSIIIIDPSMGYERCDHCIATATPTVWVWQRGSKFKYLKYFLPSLRSTPLHLSIEPLQNSARSPDELVKPLDCAAVDHALVTFTTGSTGLPKLMLRRHAFLLNQTQSLSMSYELMVHQEIGLEESEVSYATNLTLIPLHTLKVGSLCLLYPTVQTTPPASVIMELEKHNISALFGSPAFVERLAAHALKYNTMLPVKYSGVGGAPVFRASLRTIAMATPEKRVVVIYGSTEAEPISAVFAEEKMDLEQSQPEGLCVGKPVFRGTAKVVQLLQDIGMDPPPQEPVNVAEELEVERGTVGEIIVSGWHVNTYQVDPRRLVQDVDGRVWLRTEDAGWMDEEGRVWLVGRVKWRVRRGGKNYWSTVVEQKVLDRCSLITFAAYLPHPSREEACLFIEAPQGLPDRERAGLQSFLSHEAIPVDHLEVLKKLPRDRRHASKPDTAALFHSTNPNSLPKLLKLFLRSNPRVALFLIVLQLLLIVCVVVMILSQ